MPSRERVADFIATVVSGEHVRAIADFYHPHASMQENLAEPRRGRDVLMAHEQKVLDRMQMHTHPPEVVLVDGDHVVIRWVFDALPPAGKTGVPKRLIELALQRWEGNRIAEEQFFYDTATAWRPVEEAAATTARG